PARRYRSPLASNPHGHTPHIVSQDAPHAELPFGVAPNEDRVRSAGKALRASTAVDVGHPDHAEIALPSWNEVERGVHGSSTDYRPSRLADHADARIEPVRDRG